MSIAKLDAGSKAGRPAPMIITKATFTMLSKHLYFIDRVVVLF